MVLVNMFKKYDGEHYTLYFFRGINMLLYGEMTVVQMVERLPIWSQNRGRWFKSNL